MTTTPEVIDRIVDSHSLREELSKASEQKFFASGNQFLDKLIGGFAEGDLIILGGSPKSGKCLGMGTMVMMYDGTSKTVESINVGDLLMGDDSTPRKVLALGNGRGQLYRITLANKDSFVCNDEHILVLKRWIKEDTHNGRKCGFLRNGETVEMTAKEYYGKSEQWKKKYKLFKTSVEFKEKQLPIEPYFLGLWLGDGTTSGVGITTADKEVVEYIRDYAKRLSLFVSIKDQGENKSKVYNISRQTKKGKDNSLQAKLRTLGVINNKHIPYPYYANSRENRLLLLAGLLDSDGYSGGRSQIGFCNKNQELCLQVVRLGRSLGFRCSMTPKFNKRFQQMYFTVRIGGKNLNEIPLLLKRKMPNIPVTYHKKDGGRYFGHIEDIGQGEYYGFEIDGNGRFLLDDFTVTHNTTLLQTWTKQFAKQDLACLWFSVELSNREFLSRFGNDLPIFYLPRVMPTTTTHLWIEQKILEAKKKHDVKFVFVDHIGMVTDEGMFKERNAVDILDARLFRLKRFAIQQKICLIVVAPFVMQSLRKKKTEPTTGDFRGTAMVGYTADTLLGLDRQIGHKAMITANEECEDISVLAGGALISTDAYLYILDSRRTGNRKVRVKMLLDHNGDYIEA